MFHLQHSFHFPQGCSRSLVVILTSLQSSINSLNKLVTPRITMFFSSLDPRCHIYSSEVDDHGFPLSSVSHTFYNLNLGDIRKLVETLHKFSFRLPLPLSSSIFQATTTFSIPCFPMMCPGKISCQYLILSISFQ